MFSVCPRAWHSVGTQKRLVNDCDLSPRLTVQYQFKSLACSHLPNGSLNSNPRAGVANSTAYRSQAGT